MTVRSGLAAVELTDAEMSNISVNTWFANIAERLVIKSDFDDTGDPTKKKLEVLLLTKRANVKVRYIGGILMDL